MTMITGEVGNLPRIKGTAFILLTFVIFLLSSCASPQISENTTESEIFIESFGSTAAPPQSESEFVFEEEESETLFIVTDYQLFPPENQSFGAEFDEIYEKFIEAARAKNLSALDGFLSDTVISSWGGEPGKDDFYYHWGLDENPEQSQLWSELEAIISLGGSYDGESKRFSAPYIFTDFPDEFEAYGCFAVIGENTEVYGNKEIESGAIEYLNYNILKTDEVENELWDKGRSDFVKVKTLAGTEGYIQKKYIRSPLDYRLCIEYIENDGWKLTLLAAGD